MAQLEGRTCLVTGATSGIGEETALALAKLGARVVIVGRSRERGESSLDRIRRESGNPDVELMLADLASLAAIRGLAAEFLERHAALHLLVNNAAVVNLTRTTTIDGYETMFAVNHLAYFLLTNLLLDRLKASAPARIVNVASHGHRFGALDMDDLQGERSYGGMRNYGKSKFANVVFTYELARRLEGTDVTVNCLHPGAVGTRLGHNNGRLGGYLAGLLRPFFLTPTSGAATSIFVATAPELDGVTGRYFAKQREARSSPATHDEDLARHLWDASAALTGLGA